MKKIKCPNCGMLNFEMLRICSGCRKSVSPPKNVSTQSGSRKIAAHNKARPAGLPMPAKIALILLFLTGIGTGGFFGYPKVSAWLAERRRSEIAQKEIEEIDGFSRITFDADIDSYGNIYLKLPKRFRVVPPDLDTLNNFPYRNKAFGTKKLEKRDVYTPPVEDDYGRVIAGGARVVYGTPEHIRMQRVSKVKNYSYLKNESHQLVVEIDFVGVFQIIKKHESCPESQGSCIYGSLVEGNGKIQMLRTNDAWEFVSVRGQTAFSGVGVEWTKENDAYTDRVAPGIMVPTVENNKIQVPTKTWRD